MLKKIMIAMSCCMVASCGASETMVKNPIPEIIGHFGAVTPESTIKDFKNSSERLLTDLEKKDLKDLYSSEEILKDKWENGIKILKQMNEFEPEKSTYEEKNKLFEDISKITDNGFYATSYSFIQVNPSLRRLQGIFESFWQILLQAREIAVWLRCRSEDIPLANVSAIYSEAWRTIGYSSDSKIRELGNVLQSVCILREDKTFLEDLLEDDACTLKKVDEEARACLDSLYPSIPSLKRIVKQEDDTKSSY